MKNLISKLSPANFLAIVLGVVAISGVSLSIANAGSTFSRERVEKQAAKNLSESMLAEDKAEAPSFVLPEDQDKQILGAVVDPNNLPGLLCSSDNCTQIMVQSFLDASTTFVSIPSPFLKATSTGAGSEVVIFTDSGGQKYTSATTTVDLMRLNITGAATTSYSFACGASAGPTPIVPFALQGRIIVTTTAFAVPTSTVGVVESNVSVSQGALVTGGTVGKVMLGSDAPYLTCIAETSVAAGMTNPSNTFDGKAVARFNKTRL